MRRLFALFCVTVLLSACGQRVRPQHTAPVTVKVVEVRTSATPVSLTYAGTVQAAASTVISSPHSGTVDRLAVGENEDVRRGQVLAVVRSEQVQAAYDASQATLAQAQDAYDRVVRVRESGSSGVSDVQFMEVQTRLAQARSAAQAASRALESCTIKAPYDGVVGSVSVRRGVSVNAFEPIMQIFDVGTPDVRFPVPEAEIAALVPGTALEVEVPALGRSFEGTLASKGVVASALSHNYECVAKVHGEGLLPGMVCKVHIREAGDSTLVVPVSALRTGVDGRYVWCVNDGTVFKRFVETGAYSGDGVVISEGLREGDLLIVEGGRKVSSGMKVRVQF